nr:MAG TPA: hypothetical protein [Caudoviricetes sp.]DAW14175.1 MAG TPA: hypothetical protein [Caudoviricetes sp.]DAZ21526.1 MAG TPA: hypothetical protein [Caudoviricetes sp.]DAZ76569.1 MAG TPA: hypothetical protein [Caudoviricetes sp.]
MPVPCNTRIGEKQREVNKGRSTNCLNFYKQ